MAAPPETLMTPDIGLANWLAQRAARTPERKALTFEGATWTYAQLSSASRRCRAGCARSASSVARALRSSG
jgi:acyl-CoA synthetase (AMP-forming)/AMP-acid ligase II